MNKQAYAGALAIIGQPSPFGEGFSAAPPGHLNAEARTARNTDDLVELQQQAIAATLAAGMIAASGKPHTALEAVQVTREVMAVLYPVKADEPATA